MTRRPWSRCSAALVIGAALSLARCECGADLTEIPAPDILVEDPASGTTNDSGPVTLQFGDIDPGQSETLQVRLANVGTAPLTIDSYGMINDPEDERCPQSSAEFELQYPSETINPEEEERLNVVYVPRDGGGDCAVVQIRSNDPDEEEVRFYLLGTGAAPKLCASQTVVDFGEVNIGTYVTQEVELSNCGTKPLTIDTFTELQSFPPFSIAQQPSLPNGPMQPGDAVTVEFGFESAVPAAFNESDTVGQLQIETSGSVSSTAILVLQAVAVTPPTCDLDVVPRAIQLGHVRPGETRDYNAAVVNRGRLECNITSFAHSSGSSDFSLASGAAPPARTLAAGAQEIVTFRFAPQTSEVLNAVFTLESDDPIEPAIDVALEGDGTVPSGCFIEPDPLTLNFGNSSTAQTTTLPVNLRNIGDENCQVQETNVTVGGPDFFVGDVGFPIFGAIVVAGEALEVPVGFRPTSEGPMNGILSVDFKEFGFGNPTQTATVELIGAGAAPQICVTPELIDFGAVNTGQEVCQNFEIANCGGTELTLRGVTLQSGSSPAFELTPPAGLPGAMAPGTSINVQICYAPTMDTRGDLGAVEVISDDPDDSTQVVLLRGNADSLCPPYLACVPEELDMGDMPSDQSATRTVVCTNYGTEIVTVTGVTIDNAPIFTVSADTPAVLGPGDQLPVQVSFGPGYVGAFTATVAVASNACEPVIDVGITVQGVEPPLPNCIPPRTFSPQVLWRWESSSVMPQADQVWVTPLVANMNDDNGDGLIDVNDVPDVIFASFDGAEFNQNTDLQNDNGDHVNDPIRAYLRIVSGDDGRELVSVGGDQYAMDSEVNMAVADIDGDNKPEIVGGKWLVLEGEEVMSGGPKLNGKFKYGYLIAFEHDGTFKWQSEEWRGSDDDMENSGGISIADLDADGFPEILFGNNVFDHNGHHLWTGTAGAANSGHGPQSFAVDLDGQSGLEVVCGNTVYRNDGSVLWHQDGLYDGNPVVADLDGNGTPELVLRNNQLHILNALTGATVAGPFDIPNPDPSDPNNPSVIPTIPAVADFDGDSLPEIVVANESVVVVYEMDGTINWMANVFDGSGMAGPAAFDFEGDGIYEVVYADESHAYAYRGSDGTIIYTADRSSRTIAEIATVADINNDGQAEMVVVFNEPMFGLSKGVVAYTNSEGAWIGARRIYNQQAYHITNIDESGVVPREEPQHWLQGVPQNSFHSQMPRCQ